MIHLGDITKLRGWEVPIVDAITGGSPCQNFSVAGNRKGLGGDESVLFYHQIRLVKEMREHDRNNGRAGMYIRPRYCIWENVPGAFSSNGGKDFQAVLTEFARVADPEAPDVPMPDKGKWPKSGCLYDELGRWSIAWRVHDAQFWGVPQRRKRIALVADFGGLSAPEILFERKGLCWHPEPGGEERQGAAGAVGGGVEGASGALNPWDSQSARVYADSGVWHSLNANENGGQSRDSVFCIQGNGIDRADTAGCNGKGWREDVSYTLNTIDRPAVMAFDTTQITSPQNGCNPHYGDPCHPLAAGAHPPTICLNDQGGAVMNVSEDVSGALRAQEHGHQPIVAGFKAGQSMAGGIGYQEEVAATLSSQMSGTEPTVFDARGNGNGTYQTVTGPLMANSHPGSYTGQDAYNDMLVANVVSGLDCRNGKENGDLCGTLQSKPNGGFSLNFIHPVRINSIVRRLIPLECERLQGFPDNWTDSKGKKHKAADSPRYKALGNSIALPFWQYLARRICAQYERDITMASLFDGIGGFPLVFERCGARAVWASEIEEFPMAVTKARFGAE